MTGAMPLTRAPRSVALVTLGCTRNEVDSEELAGRLAAEGWRLVDDAAEADVAVVNTCGFVEQAKKDSIDALLEASDLKGDGGRTQKVVAVGCLAERYGEQLADQLPEADAVLGFDSYRDMSSHLRAILDGRATSRATRPATAARCCRCRRSSARQGARRRRAARARRRALERPRRRTIECPAPGLAVRGSSAPASTAARGRRSRSPAAATGAARSAPSRCSAARSSRAARRRHRRGALAGASAASRSSSSSARTPRRYGKDLGDLGLLEKLLPELTAIAGIERVRVSYLQPAEIRPGLLDAMADDARRRALLRHLLPARLRAAAALDAAVRRRARPSSTCSTRVRADAPQAGIRCNVIVGFPGETEADLAELEAFLAAARLDVVGVFGYSDEDGTEAEGYADKLAPRSSPSGSTRFTRLVEELNAQRAEERIGERVVVLVEEVDDEDGVRVVGRADLPGPRRRRRHPRCASPRARRRRGRRPRAGRRRRHRGDRPRRGAAMTPQTLPPGARGPRPGRTSTGTSPTP